jgi:hypothetical protein
VQAASFSVKQPISIVFQKIGNVTENQIAQMDPTKPIAVSHYAYLIQK